MNKKWYYELVEIETGEKLYVAVDVPIKVEKICSVLGIDNIAKCNGLITKEKYIAKTGEETDE